MRFESMEFRKLYTSPFVLATFILIVVLNLITSHYIYQDQGGGKLMYSANAYHKLHADIDGMSETDANIYLWSYYEELEDKYTAGQIPMLRYSDDYEKELMLLSDVGFRIEQCMNYNAYLDDIEDAVSKNLNSGLLAISGAFNYRNMEQTRMDYEKMRGLTVEYGPSKGIELFGSMMTTDFYIILFAVVLVVQLITKERESCQLALYKTTYRGHIRLIVAKANVIGISVAGMVLLLQGCNYIIGQFMYGFGDLTRPIQSVASYIGCGLSVSVGQFFILFFVAKILIHMCLSAMAFMIAVKARDSKVLYFCLAIVYGLGAVCYYGIGSTSRFCFFKYVNPVALLNNGSIIGEYRNLNILEMPYSYVSVFGFTVIICMIIFVYNAIVQFDRQRETVVTGRRQKCITMTKGAGMHLSLLGHELHKLLFDGKLLVIILGYSLYILFTNKPVSDEFYVAKDTYYNAYIEYVKGPVTEETEAFLKEETEKFERLDEQYNSVESVEYYEYMLQPYGAFVQLRDVTTPYLKMVGGEYLHDTGYRLLTGDMMTNKKDIKLGLLAVVLLIYPLSYICGIEYQQNTIVLLRSTCYGRAITIGIKVLLGVLTVTVVYVLTYLPFYWNVFREYGTESIYAPACSMQHLALVPANISILEYLIMIAVFRYVGLLLMMLGIFYASTKVRTVVGTSVIGVLFVVFPLVFAYLEIPGLYYLLLNPFIIGNVFC